MVSIRTQKIVNACGVPSIHTLQVVSGLLFKNMILVPRSNGGNLIKGDKAIIGIAGRECHDF